MRDLFLIDLQLFSADPAGGGDPNTAGTGGDDPNTDPNAGGGGGGKIEFTPEQQAHMDAVIAQRLSRAERTAAQKALEARATELGYESVEDMEAALKAHREAQEQNKTETQRLQEQLEAERQRSAQATEGARTTLINAEAKVQAVALGVKPERVDYALRLADLSSVTVGDDGAVDAAAIKTAIEAVLKDLPELKGTQTPGRSGGDFQGGGGRGDGPTTLTGAVRDYYKT